MGSLLAAAWIVTTVARGSAGVGVTHPNTTEQPPRKADPKARSEPSASQHTSMSVEQFLARRAKRLDQLPEPPAIPAPSDGADHPIDRFLLASWKEAGLDKPQDRPPLCDDSTFLRRVYLDLIGVIPTIAERDRFINDARPDKRELLIEELLARTEDYADHWTPFWEDALVSSPVGVNAGMATHGNYTAWIHRAFVENKPFDLFAAELIDPTLPGHKPAEMGSDNGAPRRVHYILNQTHTDTLQSAAGVAQVFMGTAMKCASCHNHFENSEWPQKRFLAFAGMFSDAPLEVIRCEKRTGEIVRPEFPFEVPGVPLEPATNERERFHLAATLLVDPLNTRFSQSIVNRLWKRSFGLGLIEPADDFREEFAPSHPDLLAWLADDFMRHGYDLKHTIRLIMTSRAYQARYDPAAEDHFDTAYPDAPRHFRTPSLRRLTAEQLIDSIGVATHQQLDRKSRLYRRSDSTNLSRALGKPAIRNDVSTGRSDQVAVLQGLELLNGTEFQTLTRAGTLTHRVLETDSPAAAAKVVYNAVLARDPSPRESEVVTALLSDSPAPRSDRVDDLLWVLFVSPEFQYIR